MSSPTSVDDMARTYIAAWSTTDADERRDLVDRLYTDDARFYADEPGDEPVERRGRDEIFENITQVNERLTQRGGLVTTQTGVAENHGLVKVAWQMSDADDHVVMTGMNMLTVDEAGRITRDYIFIG